MAYIGTAPARSPLSSTQLDADLTLTDSLTITGSTPTVTIGDADAEDSKLVFDGNAQDYHVGLDDTDDDLVIGVGSTLGTTTAISVDEAAKVKVEVGMLGPLYIGDTANAQNTVGLTINQGAADNEILALKSSDVAHGHTGTAETDTFLSVNKSQATKGGVRISAFAQTDNTSNSFVVVTYGNGDSLNTTKTANGGDAGMVMMYRGHDGAGSEEDVVSNGNIFSVGCGESGGGKHKFIIDEDGDIFNDGADSTAYDSYDDAALLRALELWRGEENPDTVKKQLLPSRYDGNKYSKEQLADTKLMELVSDKDWKDGDRSLVSVTTQARVTTGAVWQNHEMLDAIIETMEERDAGFTAALKKKFVARGLPTQILDWTGDIPDDLKKPDTAPAAFNAEE